MRESLLCYRTVTRLDPGNMEAWLDYGETLLELGFIKQALKAFEKAVETNPHAAEPYYFRAKALIALNRLFEAVESLRTSFKIDPQKRGEFEQEFPGIRSVKEFRNLLKQ
jgi:tetratricopeptide (TPR) repeat protein